MFIGRSALFAALYVAVMGSVALAQNASNNAPIPQCAANCMSIKINEAASWFGAGEVSSYCKHPEFLLAYNNCLRDNCKAEEIAAGKQAGTTACAGVTPNAGGNPPPAGTNPNNTTSRLSGPANPPGDNSAALNKPGTNSTAPINPALPTTPVPPTNLPNTAVNGALPVTPAVANATNTTTSAPSRFSAAVGSAAANASSQAGAASTISFSPLLALSLSALALFL